MKLLTITYLCLLFTFCSKQIWAKDYTTMDVFESKMNSSINLNNVDVNLLEQSVIFLSNVYRQQKGKKVLNYNKALNEAAYIHSSQMVNYDFFNHINNFENSLRNINDRAKYVGYEDFETLSENILYGYVDIETPGTYKDLAQFILEGFIKSKAHKDNLLDYKIDEIGCGIAFENKLKDGYWYFYFTQDFGKRF